MSYRFSVKVAQDFVEQALNRSSSTGFPARVHDLHGGSWDLVAKGL